MNDSIASYIHRKVVVLHEDQPVHEAIRAMCTNRIGCVIVSDRHGHMTGILTDRDVTCKMVPLEFDPDATLSEVMTKNLVKTSENASLDDIVSLMKEHGVRRVAITRTTKKTERCIGLVALDDLLANQQIASKDVAQIVKSQIWRRERRLRLAEQSAHAGTDADLAKLVDAVAARTGLSHETALRFANVVLAMIVRRISYTLAARLIGLLPSQMQAALLDLPAGPDHTITADNMRKWLSSDFGMTSHGVDEQLKRLWDALSDITPIDRFNLIAEQLPDDLRLLLISLSPGQNIFTTPSSPPL